MASRVGRLGMGIGMLLVLLAGVGQAHADVSTTSGMSVATNGLTVYATGSWFWPDPTASRDTKFVGYAIDWGDVTSGNALGSYHLGDGTAATNEVLRPTTPDHGAGGTFGPVTHTYKAAGSYRVCAIVYDLGSAQPFRTTGWHSLRASGVDRNKDNSVDDGLAAPPVTCATVNATSARTPGPGASATPSAGQSVAGATFAPGGSTPPPTATESPSAANGGLGLVLPLALLLLSALAGAAVLSPRRRRG